MAGSFPRRLRTPVPGGYLVTYRFPGRWMGDGEFECLRASLDDIARDRLGALPDYGVFAPGREPFEHRIVALMYAGEPKAPMAFCALVDCPVVIGGETIDVLNLGLVVARRQAPLRSSLAALYTVPLIVHLARRGARPFWVATFTAVPASVAIVSDSFEAVWPHYAGRSERTPRHRAVAQALFEQHRHESGVGAGATFDAAEAIVRGSCAGPSAVLRHEPGHSSGSQAPAASVFCRERLDYARGDEFLLLGRMSFRAIAWRALGWRRRWP